MVDMFCQEKVHGEVSRWTWTDVKIEQLEIILTSAAESGPGGF